MNYVSFMLDGHTVRVLNGPYLDDGEPTTTARAFAATLSGSLDDMRMFAAQRYLETYNSTWRGQNNSILNEDEFCARLINPFIVVYDEIGAAAIYFNDSGMFAGHLIEVSVVDGKIAYVTMVG